MSPLLRYLRGRTARAALRQSRAPPAKGGTTVKSSVSVWTLPSLALPRSGSAGVISASFRNEAPRYTKVTIDAMAKKRGVYFMTQPGLFNAMPDRVLPRQRFATLFIEVDPSADIMEVVAPVLAVLDDQFTSALRWTLGRLRFDNRLQKEVAQRRLRSGDLFEPAPRGLGPVVPDSESVSEIRSTTAELLGPWNSDVLADLAAPDALIVFTPTKLTAYELAATLRGSATEAEDEGGLSDDLISTILNEHRDWVVLRFREQCSHWDIQVAGPRKSIHHLADVLRDHGFSRFTDPLDFIEAAGAE